MISIAELPNKSWYAQCYKIAVKTARETPDQEFMGFRDYPQTATVILREFRRALHARINTRGERVSYGRKDCADWIRAMSRAARNVNTPRLIVRAQSVPCEIRNRLAHRLMV